MRRSSFAFAMLCMAGPLPVAADSLFDPKTFTPLISDKRAHRAGDSVTILIYENSSATSSARASMQRSTDASIVAAGGTQTSQHRTGGALGLNSDFDGGGVVQRSGKLLGQITATVQSVADNGDLWIKGVQLLEINSDKQEIRVEGRVRRRDVADNNTVLSNRLADAKITYLGNGDLADRQKPGWLAKVLVWMGL